MDARPTRRRTVAVLGAALAAATLAACSGASSGPATVAGGATTSAATTAPTTTTAAPTTATTTSTASAPGTTATTRPAAAPLRLTFTTVRRTVTADGVKAELPRARATGGDAASRKAAEAAVTREVDRLVAEFAATAGENADLPAAQRFDVVEATAARWRGYLTVRIEQTAQTGGAYPANTVHGLLLDARTGRAVPVATLFADTAGVDAVVRRRIVAANPQVFADGVVTAADLRPVSIVAGADGRTTPLTCLPVTKGLDCTVDQDSVAPHVVGPLRAVVPWSRLDRLMKD